MSDQNLKQRIEHSRPARRRRKPSLKSGIFVLILMLSMFALLLASCRQEGSSTTTTEGRATQVQATPTPKLTEQVLKDTAWDPQWPALPGAGTPAQPLDQVRAIYAFAARHPEVLENAPCYWGCESGGHQNVHDCFVKGKTADGKPQWDGMGFMWGICLNVARDAMTTYHEGKPAAEIQRTIDDRYAHQYKNRTPTAKPKETGNPGSQ